MAPTEFWSSTYWSNRFAAEQKYEWLVPSSTLLPLVHEQLLALALRRNPLIQFDTTDSTSRINILHIGSGSSTLGTQLQNHLDSCVCEGPSPSYQVYDADYVEPPATPTYEPDRVPFKLVDVLSMDSLEASCLGADGTTSEYEEGGKWDLILDKSTCDAISTGPLLQPSSNERLPTEPLERTVYNLGRVTRKGGRWVCISYSASRFDFLPSFPLLSSGDISHQTEMSDQYQKGVEEGRLDYGWQVVRKEIIAMTSIPEGRRIRDGEGERIVYEPETGVWMYVLLKT